MILVSLALIVCALLGLAFGATIGYYLGAQDQETRDGAELEVLRTQVEAFDHGRHLGRVFTPPRNLREAVGHIVVEDVEPGSWFDLFNRAYAHCTNCDGLGRVPCECTTWEQP